ncbi:MULTISPECIES: hypothetical protein [Enterobacterales]|uniref:Uncharacterized protein 11 n=2 Tax=root TaxID=1 RepID=C9DGL9_BPD10|nr:MULTISPECIES: hypothetical protein [Enterobacterales]YP_003335759.1 hypothetical protein EP-D108_gp11 [Escherichia phage D108]EED4178191.1 hypothetical protein [Salmonella enterica subsp. enterica serovar Newport]ACV50270.1 conserved hypothetical protein [Escherichia phage D108]EEJ9370375.1 hypothetical protein [Salmonella enterica subsp. enterica serovar Newport]EFA7743039.1 hypothetical protein [Escherichia coli]EGE3888682.1 hypothetical protein [Escherichia coli]
MVDAKILNGVSTLLRAYGRLTCGVLAEKMQMPSSAMVYFLRDAVDAGMLTELNGFYDVPRPRTEQPVRRNATEQSAVDDAAWCSFRRPLPWLEGNAIPALAKEFATGVLTCESVHIVAEVDNRMCEQGMPRFVMAYIDIRLGRFICSSSAWNITDHVLRYLILDCSPAPAAVQEVA